MSGGMGMEWCICGHHKASHGFPVNGSCGACECDDYFNESEGL
jgi:hypothetical protein